MQEFVGRHRETQADITVAALPCDAERAQAFGLMKIDEHGRIVSFAEKPTGDALRSMEVDTTILGLTPDEAMVRAHQPGSRNQGVGPGPRPARVSERLPFSA